MRKSIARRYDPSGFLTITTGDAHAVVEGSMMPYFKSSSIWFGVGGAVRFLVVGTIG